MSLSHTLNTTAPTQPVTHNFLVGDILVAQWGYSMQMVDFFKVLKVTPTRVQIAHIGQKDNVQTGFLSGTVMPDPDVIQTYNCYRTGPVISASGARAPVVKEEIFWRTPRGGVVNGHNSSAHAEMWNGKPMRYDHCD